jgi:hypothetical protein
VSPEAVPDGLSGSLLGTSSAVRLTSGELACQEMTRSTFVDYHLCVAQMSLGVAPARVASPCMDLEA